MGIQVFLHPTDIILFNIYRPPLPGCVLELDELFSIAANEPSIIISDFIAHHPFWIDPTSSIARRLDDTENHIQLLLDFFPEVSLLKSRQATHTKGGVIDLALLSTSLTLIAT